MNRLYQIRNTALAALAFMVAFGPAYAGPGTTKAKNKLARQIQRLVDSPETASTLSGEAVVFFTLYHERFIQVNGVFGNNPELLQHIEDSLTDQQVNLRGLEPGEEFQVKLKFNDLR